MLDWNNTPYHPVVEEITEHLSIKSQNNDKDFFRLITSYFLAKMASSMQATIQTKHMGDIPVNIYALALSVSGYGKGTSIGIMETDFLPDFKTYFLEDTLPNIAKKNIHKMAVKKALKYSMSESDAEDSIKQFYEKTGEYPFTFDGGTAAAVKQVRDKLLIAGIGSINLQIDEIGSNLIGSTEILNTFLELYDKGLIKQKLTKNTSDNQRAADLDGRTPTNALLFGTPVKLLDGSITEDSFYSFLATGYARRTIFCLGLPKKVNKYRGLSAAEVYKKLCDASTNNTVTKYKQHFASLADPRMYRFMITLPDQVAIELQEYKMYCEEEASKLKESQDIYATELANRYFKALKLAGTLAFVDISPIITPTHMAQAIKQVEDSGKAFKKILTREMPYMKIARYIAEQTTEVTHADLAEALPFYKTGQAARNEQITLAKAWGINNNIIITSRMNGDIEFISGKTLKTTNPDKLIVSYSPEFAHSYFNDVISWKDLTQLVTMAQNTNGPYHYCTRHFNDEHRCTECAQEPFNLLALDVDGKYDKDGNLIEAAPSIATVRDLLQEYQYILYTTKRHTDAAPRYRILMPTNYVLELDSKDYKEFMVNLMNFLPFDIDEASTDYVHNYLTNPTGQVFTNTGKCFDVMPLIPRSRSAELYQKSVKDLKNLSNLEKWFYARIQVGNRNNYLLRYGYVLADMGLTLSQVLDKVRSFNQQLTEPISEKELSTTIQVSLAKKFGEKQ
mgnify:CR=1 FL=1